MKNHFTILLVIYYCECYIPSHVVYMLLEKVCVLASNEKPFIQFHLG